MSVACWKMLRALGIVSRLCRVSTVCCSALVVSMMGDSPVTVTVSCRSPGLNVTLIVAVNDATSSIPSRRTGPKPESVNVTAYTPGRRSTILYWPFPSVPSVFVFSINAGLLASTVTPGRTPPVESFATPVIALCAYAVELQTISARTLTNSNLERFMENSLVYIDGCGVRDFWGKRRACNVTRTSPEDHLAQISERFFAHL